MSPDPSALPARKLAVVTCMDCRIDPLQAASLDLGEAHVIRNAGAVVTDDVLRSLALSQHALGTREVWVVMHTGCGVLGLDDAAFLDSVEAETGARPAWSPGGFPSLEQGVRDGVARIEGDPTLLTTRVRGYVLDIETGQLNEVTVEADGA